MATEVEIVAVAGPVEDIDEMRNLLDA